MSPRTIKAIREPRSQVGAIVASGGIQKLVETSGRLPPVSLTIRPLDGAAPIVLDRFLTYKFNSSILVPVDTFEFNFVAPDDPKSFYSRVKDGDIVVLSAAGRTIATGIIDMIDIEIDEEFGEKIAITGRDLMAQFEDQDAISIDDKPIWAEKFTMSQVIGALSANTRITKFQLQQAPKKPYLFATEPGESKLAALQRFLEPLNCLAWMDPTGSLIVGRPNMHQGSKGLLFVSKERRDSNVISIKASRNSTSIPNIMVPIWSGQETILNRIPPEQRLNNYSFGPDRLRKLGHRVPKAVVISNPQGGEPQDLSHINDFLVAQGLAEVKEAKVGSVNILQAYAKRELARANIKELLVQVVAPGHYNEKGEPFQIDTIYDIEFDRGQVNEKMYLYGVDYEMDEEKSQRAILQFCRLGRIVSDIKAP